MTGILFAEMSPEPEWEGEFNLWYDNDHIRSRMQIDGFQGAQRYRAVGGRAYAVIYEMNSLDALSSPAYEHLRTHESEQTEWMLANVRGFTRSLGTEAGSHHFDEPAREAPFILVTMFDVPPGYLTDFDGWMTEEHIPLLLASPHWIGVRRFHMTFNDPYRFNRMTVHYLANQEVLSSKERAQARAAPRRALLSEQHDWFRAAKTAVYRRHGPFFRATASG